MSFFLPTLKCVLVCFALAFFVLAGNAQAQTDCSDTATTGVVQAQCEALLDFYNQTNGAGWAHKTRWNSTEPISIWHGITVSGDQVTRIALSSNRLSGEIPATLWSNLPSLETLYLNHNTFSGGIPDLSALTNLSELFLHQNDLRGEIPATLGNLPNLQKLHLHNNELTGTIPDLSPLTSLLELDIYNNQLTGTIPATLGNLTNLDRLFFQFNRLTGTIPAILGSITSLEFLRFHDNQLTGTIPATLGNLTNLRQVRFYNNQLSGTIPSELGELTGVSDLSLYNNQLTGSIPPELAELTDQIRLNFQDNQLSGTIPPELGELTKLTQFYLYNNQLTGSIPSQLGELTKLTRMNISQNQLSGAIPPELGKLTLLEWLYLQDNRLSGDVPSSLGGLTRLQKLWLDDNDLVMVPTELEALGERLAFVELSLWGNERLVWEMPMSNELGRRADRAALLELYENTGGRNREAWKNQNGWRNGLPSSSWYGVKTSSNGRVSELDLSDNNLVRGLTNAFESLDNISLIDLSSNQLSGAIPSEIGTLKNLVQLKLNDNRLSCDIPDLSSINGIRVELQNNRHLGGTLSANLVGKWDIRDLLDISCTGIETPDTTAFEAWLSGFTSFLNDQSDCELEVMPSCSPGVTGVALVERVEELSVSWEEFPGASGYKVQWKSGAQDFDSTRQYTVTSGSTTTTYTIPNLTAGRLYTIIVIAIVSNAESPQSEEVTGIPTGILPPPPPPPPPPSPTIGPEQPEQQPGDLDRGVTGVEVRTEELGQLSVSWDRFAGASGYRIEWKSEDSQEFDQDTVGESTTSYVITGLDPGTEYTVGVIAIVSNAESTPSVATGIPLGEEPQPTPGTEQQGGGGCAIGSDVPGEVSQSALFNMLVVMSALLAVSRRKKE